MGVASAAAAVAVCAALGVSCGKRGGGGGASDRKADEQPSTLSPEPALEPQQKVAKEGSRLAERQESGDAVDLSALAELSLPAPSDARLAQLRAEVRSGSYQVPAPDLAKKIIKVWNCPSTVSEVTTGIFCWPARPLHHTIKGYKGQYNDFSHVIFLTAAGPDGSVSGRTTSRGVTSPAASLW